MDFNLDEIKKEQDANNRRKKILMAVGAIGDVAANNPSAAHLYLGQKQQKQDVSGFADKVAGLRKDPIKKRMDQYKIHQANQGISKGKADSDTSANYRKGISAIFPTLGPKLEGMSYNEMKEFSPMLTQKLRDEKDWDQQVKLKEMELRAKERSGKNLSPAQKKIDETVGKDIAEFTYGGGYAGVQKNLENLENIIGQLENTDMASGPIVSRMPFQDVWNPGAVDVKDRVRDIVFQSLRDTLGAQFTEKEGERLVEASYNEKLDEAQNAQRLRATLKSIQNMAKAKAAAAEHLQKYGTLSNYSGPMPQDIMGAGASGGFNGGPKSSASAGMSEDEERELMELEREFGGR